MLLGGRDGPQPGFAALMPRAPWHHAGGRARHAPNSACLQRTAARQSG